MKSKTIANKIMAIMTAMAVAISPTMAFASEETQNPTEASTKVKYEGVDSYYSVVVPTKIELKPDGTAEFNVRAEGELNNWFANEYNKEICIPYFSFFICSGDAEGNMYPGCYLYQDGKEPIFAEFHEEASTIYAKNYMEHEGIDNYKESSGCYAYFCNSLPTWVRNLTNKELGRGYGWFYAGMSQEQFSHFTFGYDMGTEVPITVNLEGNVPVPAGEWKGEIGIGIFYDKDYSVKIGANACDEAAEAYNELVANGQGVGAP